MPYQLVSEIVWGLRLDKRVILVVLLNGRMLLYCNCLVRSVIALDAASVHELVDLRLSQTRLSKSVDDLTRHSLVVPYFLREFN